MTNVIFDQNGLDDDDNNNHEKTSRKKGKLTNEC